MTQTQQDLIANCLTAATLLPLFSSVVIIFFGKKVLGQFSGWLATGVMGVSLLCSIVALLTWMGADEPGAIVWKIHWIPHAGAADHWLYLGLLADHLSVALMVMVTSISFLVHLYSIGYMAGDKLFERFFAYLSLFTFSMLGIVTANGLVQLFVFWELVGLTSYLLIGFWFERRAPQLACKKAFVMNRMGDTGFLIGLGILFYKLGGALMLPAAEGVVVDGEPLTSMFGAIQAVLAAESEAAGLTGAAVYSFTNPPIWLTAAGIGLFFGAIGKSAQFPLHTWLPDAMEGPTPVSSIVHSATMVAAGVYLTARIYPILTPGAHLFVATIGLITLVMAACMALVMTDIKRVLAYSTLSQLGYMILGLGAGAYAFALFHLVTHAFFKCCLFQCAGSVIHAAHHQQDMRHYGGLAKKLPWTCACYLVCTLAIAGASIPWGPGLTGGFYSKDGIIAGTINYGHAMREQYGGWADIYWLGPTIIAYVTVFYMARSFALTFLGKPRDEHVHDHAHEAPWTMVVPQICLALMAVLSVPVLMGFWKNLIVASEPSVTWVQTVETMADSHGMHATHAYLLHGIAWIIMLALGILIYRRGMTISSRIVEIPVIKQLYTWALNKFYFDALYDIFTVNLGKLVAQVFGAIDYYLVDGLVNLCGWSGRFSSWVVGVFDNHVIDGLVNGAASAAQGGGQLLRTSQPGRIRVYVLLLFVSVAIIILVVITTMSVMS